MSNIRCGNCGFLNFASDLSCKRCKATFEEAMTPPPPMGQQFAELQPAFEGGYQPEPWPQQAYQPYYLPTPLAPLPKVSRNGATNAGLWVLLTLAVAVAVGIGVLWKFGKSSPTLSNWQEYRAQDNSYTVQMPVKPIETVQNQPTPAGDVQMHMSMGLGDERGIYMVAYGDYPNARASSVPTGTMLNAAADGAVANSGATGISKKSIMLGNYQGIEVEMDIPATKLPGGGKAVCRIFWVAPRIYMVFVGGQESSAVFASRAKFLDSFKIMR